MISHKIASRFLIGSSDNLCIKNIDLLCVNGIVTYVTDNSVPKHLDKGVIVPAFFNMHSHLGESVFRYIGGNDWTIEKYLEYTERYNKGLSKTEKINVWNESADYSAEQMFRQGTLGFCAARSSAVAKQYDMLAMSGFPIMDSEKLIAFKNSGIQGFRSFCQNNESAECKVGIFLHSVYSNDESSFRLARECLRECAGFISIHVSEDMATARLESERYGMSAVELLDSYGLLSKKAILVHCGCCSDSDLMLIKERGALICVCPISNSFLNTKTVDLYKLDTIGIPWCITTDGLATGRTFSLLEQIRFVRALYPQIPLSRYWESITTVPAKYFGMPLYTGTVREGVKSTFLLTDYRGTDPSELIANLIEGEIEFKPIKL